jgi:hypothetical protein
MAAHYVPNNDRRGHWRCYIHKHPHWVQSDAAQACFGALQGDFTHMLQGARVAAAGGALVARGFR